MYLGRLVEVAERNAVFGRPLHPYTQAASRIDDDHRAGSRNSTCALARICSLARIATERVPLPPAMSEGIGYMGSQAPPHRRIPEGEVECHLPVEPG
jgi:ABC-type antimicrobial peptide transport system ATPase subunit